MDTLADVSVEIPFKARIEFKDQKVQVIGSLELLTKMQNIKKQFGPNPKVWPLQNVNNGEDILINEFILKLNTKFNFVYTHQELCHCRNVDTEKVFNSIKDNRFTVEEISRATQAGTGCGSCHKDIKSLIQQFKT